MDTKTPPSLSDDLIAFIPGLRAFAVSLSGNRTNADDLVQETLVKAWDKLDTFERGSNLRAWLFRILRNTYYSDLRKRRNESSHADGVPVEELAAKAEQPGYVELQEFRAALNQVCAERREALILVGAVGLSYREAAQICGCEPGTVKSRVSRARAELADLLKLERKTEPVKRKAESAK